MTDIHILASETIGFRPPRRSWGTLELRYFLPKDQAESSFNYFSHGTSFQVDAMCVVNQAIEDRIGNGGIANMLMPVFDGKLAGENGGATAVAIFVDFQQVSSFHIG